MNDQSSIRLASASAKAATLHRMVMPHHTCPYGLKAKHLLESKGYAVDDRWLTTREETDAFKAAHGVKTTPQVFVGGERIGGFDDLRRYFGLKVADPNATSYGPVIAVFAAAGALALAASQAAFHTPFTGRALEWFVAFAMVILAMLKLQDVERFSTMFLNYDLLAKRWVPYGYIYPFAEFTAGALMAAHALDWLSIPLALFIGSIGAISVFHAVYVQKRELKCACVGGASRVPLGFVSLSENLFMVGMAAWMLARNFWGIVMKTLLLTAVTSLALLPPVAALAQDHSGHEGHQPAPAGSPSPAPAMQDHSTHEMALPANEHGTDAQPVEASGTSRLPEAEEMMPGLHFDLGDGWMGMAHGYAWSLYTDQSGPRGDDGVFVQSMTMLMAEKPFEGGRVQLRGMWSAEPLMGAPGYPGPFATGETAGGAPLVDRQHPHDFFMELAARVDLDVAPGTRAFLYGGLVGEPALGPPAFMHRASARLNPEAPITHHWFDSTHITYGVVTAGVASPLWQLEGSAFRGREPDEERWDIETPKLDSWSVRATLTPSPNWALQVSHGWLKDPEALHGGQDEARTTASVHYSSGIGLDATAAFSAKDGRPGDTLTAWLAEATWNVTDRHTLFGRLESVANDELFPDHSDPLLDVRFRVGKLQAGYAYTLPMGPFDVSLGGTVATFLKPDSLDQAYGRDPIGYTLFAKLTLGR